MPAAFNFSSKARMLPAIQNKQGIVHIFTYLITKTIMKYRFAIVLTILISSKYLVNELKKNFSLQHRTAY